MVMLAAAAAVPGSGAAAAPNPRLASLQIEIWPEHDRPQNLVILRGELASDASLPAAVTLRIPASARAPSAVAYADASGKLLNLNYERQDAGGFVLLRLTTPQRSFHVEFYDPLVSSQAGREYRYAWPGDFAVERLGVLVKEPAAAVDLSVSPELAIVGTSPDGLKYRAGDFGALKAGEQWLIALRYTKTDPRSTTEILGAGAAMSGPANDEPRPIWLLAAAGAGLVLAAGAVLVWRRRRRSGALRHAGGAAFCPKCGRGAAPGDRFCSGCGAALK